MHISSSFIAQCSGLKKLIPLVFSISIILNILVFIILFLPVTEFLHKPLIVNERPRKSEFVVVLPAGIYKSGLPDFGTLVRLRKGLELYRDGWVNKIICAGGVRLGGTTKPISEYMKETLILNGVTPNDIFAIGEIANNSNTYTDITYLVKKYETDFDFNKAMFVTSSYHTYRIKQILLKKDIKAQVVSVDPGEMKPRIWSERLFPFYQIVREYLAICYFKIRGYI